MKNILYNQIYINDLDKINNNHDFTKLKNSTILITGGLGLIGAAVVDVLYRANTTKNLNIKILVAARNLEKFNEKYANLENISFLYYDALKPIEFNTPADYIINCASIASPQLYVETPVETLLTSFYGTQNLLNYCLQHKIQKFLYVSSSEVYGNKDSISPYEENHESRINLTNIRSSYAIGKISSEFLCKSYSAEYNLSCVIVRPGHIFGPTATTSDKKISSEFAYLSAKGQDLVLKSTGRQQRSYCYSLDCAAAILISLINGVSGESYNIGHDEITSIYQMANYMAKAGNVNLISAKATIDEQQAFNPMDNSALNNIKIKNLGYKDSFSIKEACEHTVQIIKDIV